ncbi:MAG: TRAP transporter substrate-binding protein [Myxococcota bacterium]|nr:TRAP transporter substrate-binding protein [Myxococcota bacterium]
MKRQMGGLCWVGLLLGFLVALGGCGEPSQGRVIRLGHGLGTTHPVHEALEYMAERARIRSGGRLQVEVYPAEQLCSERECLELLQIGSLDMTKVSASVMENFAPSFRVLGLPYLFRDAAHERVVLEGEIGQQLLEEARPQRLLGLAFYDAGSRSFYTRSTPIRRPRDLEGLKIRTQESPTAMALVRALGGAPTPLAWGELYSALQQGVVDGAENNPASFYLSGHFEVARFLTLDEHTRVPDVLLIGTGSWGRLDGAEQEWLRKAARDSVSRQRTLWQEHRERALAAVEAAGVTVIRPDKSLFVERTESIKGNFADSEELRSLLGSIRHAGE